MTSPAFSFYPKDFLAGTATMSLAEVGAYVKLLAYQWDAGSVPAAARERARILGCTAGEERRLWSTVVGKFVFVQDRFQNARLERERCKQQRYRAEAAEAGKRGAEKRWGPHGAPQWGHHSPPYSPPHSPPHALPQWGLDGSSSSSSGISEDGNSPPVAPQGGRARKRRRHVREIPAADPVAVQQTIDTRARRAEMAAQGLTDAAIEAVLDAEYDARRRA